MHEDISFVVNMRPYYFFLGLVLQLSLSLTACGSSAPSSLTRLTIGVVSYGEGAQSLEQYADLEAHLEAKLKSLIELEPAFNELQALQQVNQQNWDLVFAPPGLAAIAIAEGQYLPILPQAGRQQNRSVIIVKDSSPIQKLPELTQKTIALGQEGSATGYYFPIYNLYGLTLAAVKFAPTPRTVLEWVDEGQVAAGALSLAELEQYQPEFKRTRFRVLHQDSHPIPTGAVLVGPTIERNRQEQILRALEDTPSRTAATAGFIPNAPPPDYKNLIKVVKQVRPIAKRIKQSPARFFQE